MNYIGSGLNSTTLQKGRRYRCKLDTLADVKHEMAKVYREARSGLLDNQDATKLVWLLERIGNVIETEDLERRIAALEGNPNEQT